MIIFCVDGPSRCCIVGNRTCVSSLKRLLNSNKHANVLIKAMFFSNVKYTCGRGVNNSVKSAVYDRGDDAHKY